MSHVVGKPDFNGRRLIPNRFCFIIDRAPSIRPIDYVSSVKKRGWLNAIRMKLYNLIFQMVIPFLTQPPHERTLTGWGSRVYPKVGASGCTPTVGAANAP